MADAELKAKHERFARAAANVAAGWGRATIEQSDDSTRGEASLPLSIQKELPHA